jgi:hypothetical protein
MHKLWIRMRASVIDALRNTPVEVAIGLGLAAALSAFIAGWWENDADMGRLFLTAFLGLCAIFATSASHALKVFDSRTRWLLTTVFGASIAAYGTWVLEVPLATEMWRWAFLAVAAVMGVMLVPVAARMGEVSGSERFWRYNMRLLNRVAVAGAYAFSLFAGLALGVAAIDGLFELSINDDIYGHLFAWIVVGLGTVLAVGSLTEVKRIGEPFGRENLMWGGRLGTFLFMPLVLLYLGIMYVYLAKLLVTGVVPSNILSPLALGAGMLGYFGLFVLQPQMHREDFKPLAAVLRAFPAAFIPIVPFGIWAVWQRVAQYGWTEFRYARMAALVCLGLFSLIGAYKWLRKQEFSLVTGPAILAAIACLSAVGPWGASNVSRASQVQRLEHALRQSELLGPDGRMLSKQVVEAHAFEGEHGTTVRESLDYLLTEHGDEAVAHLSPIDLSEHDYSWEKLTALGVNDIPMSGTVISLYVGATTEESKRGSRERSSWSHKGRTAGGLTSSSTSMTQRVRGSFDATNCSDQSAMPMAISSVRSACAT